MLPEIIETERLRLRPPVEADAVLIFNEYAQDAEVVRYLMWRPHESVAGTHTFIARCIEARANGNAYPYVITAKDTGALLGMIEARVQGSKADLGYVIARRFWGQGYASEAALAAVQYLLAEPAIYRVWAICDAENRASARVLEKVGMHYEGTLHRWILHPNISDIPRDALCYAIWK